MSGPESHADKNLAVHVSVLRLSLGEAGNTDDEMRILEQTLQAHSLDPATLIFRGISQSRLSAVQAHGTDLPQHETIMAHTWESFHVLRSLGEGTPIDYAFDHVDPMLLAYNRALLQPVVNVERYNPDNHFPIELFQFIGDPKEALAAILLLED
jgi:hypothetical protein